MHETKISLLFCVTLIIPSFSLKFFLSDLNNCRLGVKGGNHDTTCYKFFFGEKSEHFFIEEGKEGTLICSRACVLLHPFSAVAKWYLEILNPGS